MEDDLLIANIWSFPNGNSNTSERHDRQTTTIRRRSVDDVWADTHHQLHENQRNEQGQLPSKLSGEITLEDFLVTAGIVGKSATPLPTVLQQQQQRYAIVPPEYGFGLTGNVRSLEGGGGRKQQVAAKEKVVERRQRRMIKNRESAARSRARKQAYTVDLEGELSHLKEENARLKEQERKLLAFNQLFLSSMAGRADVNALKRIRRLRRFSSSQW